MSPRATRSLRSSAPWPACRDHRAAHVLRLRAARARTRAGAATRSWSRSPTARSIRSRSRRRAQARPRRAEVHRAPDRDPRRPRPRHVGDEAPRRWRRGSAAVSSRSLPAASSRRRLRHEIPDAGHRLRQAARAGRRCCDRARRARVSARSATPSLEAQPAPSPRSMPLRMAAAPCCKSSVSKPVRIMR